jgi:hypothetical protein
MFARLAIKTDDSGKNKRVYFRVKTILADGSYFGWEIDPHTLEEKGCTDSKTTLHLIHHACIVKVRPLYEDIMYGNLTTLTIEEQKRKYGYE